MINIIFILLLTIFQIDFAIVVNKKFGELMVSLFGCHHEQTRTIAFLDIRVSFISCKGEYTLKVFARIVCGPFEVLNFLRKLKELDLVNSWD